MRHGQLKCFTFLLSGLVTVLAGCGRQADDANGDIDEIARSAIGCTAGRLKSGLNYENSVTADLGSKLSVRSAPSGRGKLVGSLSYQDAVFVKTINTGSPDFVEIYRPAALSCANTGCQETRMFVSHKYLEPVNYPSSCKPASSVANSEEIEPSRGGLSGGQLTEEIRKFTSSGNTKSMISYAQANKRSASTGMCLRYVKLAMLHGGKFFQSYPQEVAARNFGPQMKAVDFENILEYPEYRRAILGDMRKIPVGCVAVYGYININADRNAKYGHIEVRTTNGFVSDYFSALPRTGSWTSSAARNRKLTGVYCKI